MSDLSVTIHNLEQLLSGDGDFNDFKNGEVALFKKDVASLPAVLQPATNLIVASLEAGASALVGIGQTAIGPIIAESSDDQATLVLNLLQKVGVPTGGALLSLPEHVALVAVLNGLKAGIDRVGLQISTAGITQKAAA